MHLRCFCYNFIINVLAAGDINRYFDSLDYEGVAYTKRYDIFIIKCRCIINGCYSVQPIATFKQVGNCRYQIVLQSIAESKLMNVKLHSNILNPPPQKKII